MGGALRIASRSVVFAIQVLGAIFVGNVLVIASAQFSAPDNIPPTVSIMVTPLRSPANSPPVVSAGPSQTIQISSGVTLAGTATDDGYPLGGTLTVGWSKVNGPGSVVFVNANSLNAMASFTMVGSYTLRLTATDGALSNSADVSISVNAPNSQLSIGTVSVPDGIVGAPYPATGLIASGGSSPYTWSVASGSSLPGGMTLSIAGVLSGTPSAAASYSFSVQVTDAAQNVTFKLFSITVTPAKYDFSLNISGPTHVVQGHTLYLLLDLALLSGSRDYVNFTVSGLPSGATGSFPDLELTCCGKTQAWSPGPTTLSINTTASTLQGSFLVNVIAVSGGLTRNASYVIYVDPVPDPLPMTPITGALPIPSLAKWESNMLLYGQQHCAGLQDPTVPMDQRLAATYYDAERVYYQIGAYTASPIWNDCAQAAEQIYRDSYVIPNNGSVPGYWDFSKGLRLDFELTGDSTSRNAALLLSQHAGYASISTLNSIISPSFSREIAYATLSYVNVEKIGYPRNPQIQAYVDIMLGHIDQWFVSKNYRCPTNCDPAAAAGNYYIQPFMVGLTMEALIDYYQEISPDPRIPSAVKVATDWLRAHAWYAQNQTFWYDNNVSDPSQIPMGYWATAAAPSATDLNLLIAPAYAWLYRMTGDNAYRDEGDQVFAGGVATAWLAGPKQFNQNYKWSFDFVKWRSGN